MIISRDLQVRIMERLTALEKLGETNSENYFLLKEIMKETATISKKRPEIKVEKK